MIETIGGKVIHPVCGLPGGVSRPITEENKKEFVKAAEYLVEFTVLVALELFEKKVFRNENYMSLIQGDIFKHETYYMGLVDENNKVNFYDGQLRIVDPNGKEISKFKAKEYLDHIGEHVEPWSYTRFSFLKNVGWKGFVDGKNSGILRVAPLARLNVADGMSTPLAQEEYDKMIDAMGGKPVHNSLAYHWARLIETIYASERILEILNDPELTSSDVRNIPTEVPYEGIGVVEAPRGTLIHHYHTDKRGILTGINLIVATQNNAAAICLSVDKAAKSLIHKGNVPDKILNMVEMAFRTYDPCFACATHSLPGRMPLEVNIYDSQKDLIRTLKRD
jgi:F420-non-reducing hydrogenase large subunit